ncbi:MAG: hypothetical protein EP349_01870 [Alphaproteobacteria bacterium]|nr:MAG: hypothetical protein EP349_01870 [Alphaproteobacteria bacterium]
MKRYSALSILALLAVLLSFTAAGKAHAARCYNISQFEAEQGLRIHSELMVIGLTCQLIPGYNGLYSQYQQFTHKNRTLIADYENRLINFYKTRGSGEPTKKLHTLRTDIANEISQHAIKMSVTSFCNHFSPRLERALSMDQATLQRWARQIWPDQKTSTPLCRQDEATLIKEASARPRGTPERKYVRR